MYAYMYIYVHVCTSIYVYIYTYTHMSVHGCIDFKEYSKQNAILKKNHFQKTSPYSIVAQTIQRIQTQIKIQ